MESRKRKGLLIVIVVLAVFGLSLGFAAYSQTLTVKSSAEFNPDDINFNVDFSKASDSVVGGEVTPTLSPSDSQNFTATNGVIDNSDSGNAVIKNLHAVFTKPGQSVTYSFYTKNAGDLKAFLKSVTFYNVSGESVTKKCTPKASTTPSLVESACSGIKLKLIVGSEEFTETKVRNQFESPTAHDLAKNGSEQIKVIISYEDGSELADGGFDVSFGDIILLYTSNS